MPPKASKVIKAEWAGDAYEHIAPRAIKPNRLVGVDLREVNAPAAPALYSVKSTLIGELAGFDRFTK